jgi:hypothetical protein
VVVPSAARPKLLVPRRPRRVAAGAVRNFKTAAGARERLRLQALAAAFRIGAHDLLADRIVVTGAPGAAPSGIDAHLSEVFGRRVFVSLYIGPARAVRKPVLQVLDGGGDTLGFAKLGIDDFTRTLVRAEAEAVTRLNRVPWSTLRLPDVVHAGAWHQHELLVQSALPRGRAVDHDDPLLRVAMNELAAVDGRLTSSLGDSTYWRRLTARIEALPDSAMAAVLRAARPTVEQAAAGTVLAFGATHGDWAPWNMTVVDDRVLVWDWEKYERDVPVGFDAVHYAVQGAVVLGGRSPLAAFADAFERADEFVGLIAAGPDAGLLTGWLYAVDIATRYLVDREQEAGRTRMADLTSWLPGVLDLAATRAARGVRP